MVRTQYRFLSSQSIMMGDIPVDIRYSKLTEWNFLGIESLVYNASNGFRIFSVAAS